MANNPHHKPTFPLKQRLFRVAWGLIERTLFRTSPPSLFRYRNALLRLFGAEIHPHALIYPSVIVWSPAQLTVGAGGCLGHRVRVYNIGRVTIADRALVSQDVTLCTGTHDYRDPAFPLLSSPITVEEDAWVCAEAFVGPGVTVGAGSVVGARSVVTRDTPPWMVCAGNPCKPLKPRARREGSGT